MQQLLSKLIYQFIFYDRKGASMRIYTSYYKKFDHCTFDKVMVRVSNSQPAWFAWETYNLTEVYPGWQLVQGLKMRYITEEEYTEAYRKHLENLDRDALIAKLQELSDQHFGADIVLLCWENKSSFCHRHILAEWLNCDVTEWEG